MIELLRDLIYQKPRKYGSNYSISYILGDAGFLSSTVRFKNAVPDEGGVSS